MRETLIGGSSCETDRGRCRSAPSPSGCRDTRSAAPPGCRLREPLGRRRCSGARPGSRGSWRARIRSAAVDAEPRCPAAAEDLLRSFGERSRRLRERHEVRDQHAIRRMRRTNASSAATAGERRQRRPRTERARRAGRRDHFRRRRFAGRERRRQRIAARAAPPRRPAPTTGRRAGSGSRQRRIARSIAGSSVATICGGGVMPACSCLRDQLGERLRLEGAPAR